MKCCSVESKSITDIQALQRPLPSSHVIPFVKKIAQTVPHLNGENPIDLNHQKQRGSSTEHHLWDAHSISVGQEQLLREVRLSAHPHLEQAKTSPWTFSWCELPMIQSVRYSTSLLRNFISCRKVRSSRLTIIASTN